MNKQMLKRFFAFILCMAQLVTCVPCVHAESLSATDGEVIHNHVDASDESIAGEAEIQPEADGESQPEADGEIQPEADGEIQPEAEGEIQPEADGESQPEADGESQPEADGESQPEAEGEIQPEADGEIQPEADGEIQPEADGESQPEADGEIQPEADGESQPEADGEIQPEADGESQPEADGEDQSVFQPQESAESAGVMLTAVDPASCEHPEDQVNSWDEYYLAEDEHWTSDDEYTHSAMASLVTFHECRACGEAWNDEIGKPIETTRGHHFIEGVCSECSYKTVCKHPNERWWTDYMLIGSDNWQMEDARTHSGYASKVVYHLCLDCGNEWTVFAGEPAQMSENHSFDGDCVCTKCGYENECEHPQAKVDSEWHIYTNDPKENEDGKTHTGTGDKYTGYSCPDCGEWFEKRIEENVKITANHDFRDGLCTDCGYQNECQHPQESVTELWEEYVLEDGESWKSKDEHMHSAKASIVTTYECPLCGETWEKLKEEAALRERKHDFYKGVCWDCGYVNLCEHNNVTTYTWYSYTDKPTPNADGRTHSGIATEYRAQECLDCGEFDAYKETLATGVEYQEYHNYSEDETCTECGYVNPCEHNNVRNYEGSEVIGTPTPNEDGKTHTSIVDKYSFDICLDCGRSGLNYQIVETDVPLQENHLFFNGTCWFCYYVNPCEHNNVITYTWYSYTDDPTPNEDGKTHTSIGNYCSADKCLDCGELDLNKRITSSDVPRQEDHDFENGMCWCGYVNPCEHTHVQNYEGFEYFGTPTPNEDGKTHTIIGNYFSADECLDCGEDDLNYQIVETYVPLQENHEFSNGTCWCGYEERTCEHNYEPADPACSDVSYATTANGHVKSYTKTTTYTCSDCGDSYDESEPVTDDPEAHSFNAEHVCTVCTYECKHDYNLGDPVNGETSYTYDETGHTASYTQSTTYDCALCGDQKTETETVTEPKAEHTLVKGKCLCGYCEHLTYTDGKCDECGKECKHESYTDGKCDECGEECKHESYTDGKCDECGEECQHESYTDGKCDECGKVCQHESYTDSVCDECGEECKHESYTDSVCDACKYVCTHEKTNSKKVDVLDEGEKWTDDGNQSTHSAKGKQNTEYVCAECSESWTEEAETSTLLTRKHSYKSGACVNCGAKKPSSDSSKKSDTSSNTFVTPILTPTPAPAEPEEMVAALTETVVQAEQEGASVTVDIVGAEEVFTPEHYEQVRKLPISEQILVTLASIGFEDVVAAAMQTMDVELSEEAAALMEQMNDTIEAMTDEERAEMQRKIEENFPKTEIIVDGVTYEAFVLELEINVDNKVRVERYSFRFDQTLGEWIFTKLDLVDAYVLREGTAQ